MEIVNAENLDSTLIEKEIKRRVKKMRKRGELCSHCEKNKAKGVSIIMGRQYHGGDLDQIQLHTIPVCKRCSRRKDIDELNIKKITEDLEEVESLMNINPTGTA